MRDPRDVNASRIRSSARYALFIPSSLFFSSPYGSLEAHDLAIVFKESLKFLRDLRGNEWASASFRISRVFPSADLRSAAPNSCWPRKISTLFNGRKACAGWNLRGIRFASASTLAVLHQANCSYRCSRYTRVNCNWRIYATRDWIASYELRNVNGEPYRRSSGIRILFKFLTTSTFARHSECTWESLIYICAKAALTSLLENKIRLHFRYGRTLSLSRCCYYSKHSWPAVSDFERLARTRIIARNKREWEADARTSRGTRTRIKAAKRIATGAHCANGVFEIFERQKTLLRGLLSWGMRDWHERKGCVCSKTVGGDTAIVVSHATRLDRCRKEQQGPIRISTGKCCSLVIGIAQGNCPRELNDARLARILRRSDA